MFNYPLKIFQYFPFWPLLQLLFFHLYFMIIKIDQSNQIILLFNHQQSLFSKFYLKELYNILLLNFITLKNFQAFHLNYHKFNFFLNKHEKCFILITGNLIRIIIKITLPNFMDEIYVSIYLAQINSISLIIAFFEFFSLNYFDVSFF